MRRKLMGVFKANGDPELLKSFHSDIKDGHPLNSHLDILQKHLPLNPCPIEQNFDWIGQAKQGLRNASFIPTQIPKMVMH